MVAHTKVEARRVIDMLELRKYAEKAVEKKLLDTKEVDDALREYRQFLLLLWINHTISNDTLVVPTERADRIWHEHILFTESYHEFSYALIGRYIHHQPGLEKGSAPFNKAVEHTRKVHREHSSDGGYAPQYLAGCGSPSPVKTSHSSKQKSEGGGCGGVGGGCGTATTAPAPAPASCGGASCGGAGCGGGGCGGG